MLTASTGLMSIADGERVITQIRVNDTGAATCSFIINSNVYPFLAKAVYMAQDDYAELWVYHTDTSARNTPGAVDSNFLTGHRFA